MTTPLSEPDQHPWDDVFVLREFALRDGYTLEQTSRFRDDTWRLGPARQQMHQRALILSFTTIGRRYRILAKELFCVYLAMPLPPGVDRRDVTSIRGEFSVIKRFLTWLDEQHGGPDLAALTGADVTAYNQYLRAEFRSTQAAQRTRSAVSRIWRFRNSLPGDRLLFDPGNVTGWPTFTRQRRGENRTDRLPEQVMGPLIVWATRFVDVFAPDIVATAAEWTQLRHNFATTPNPQRARRADLLPALEKLLVRHVETRRPLPGRRGRVNLSFLANTLMATRVSFVRTPAYVQAIAAAAATVGIDDETYFYTPIRAELDGTPWLERISNERGDRSLTVLSRMLQLACYILIAFYSGMRDSEVKHLRRGGLRIERDPEGVAYRSKVTARAFKGERDRTGVEAVWVVGEPAARAVQVLEALQPAHTTILFQNLPYGTGWADEDAGRALTTSRTNEWLNRFVRWVNDYCDQHGRHDHIPDVNGRPWELKTSQFRRTLAWFIARRPGGAIAGALAFRHHAIQMFEGYAGTSDSGFRAEVESEQALARGEHLVELAVARR